MYKSMIGKWLVESITGKRYIASSFADMLTILTCSYRASAGWTFVVELNQSERLFTFQER